MLRLMSPEGDRLEVLATLIEAYEEKHYSIPLPDPVEAILTTLKAAASPAGTLYHSSEAALVFPRS